MTHVDDILDRYNLDRDEATDYILSITHQNQSETADTIGVTRQTVNQKHKQAFTDMTDRERALVIASLATDAVLENGIPTSST